MTMADNTEIESLKSEVRELTETVALATGIGDGFYVRADSGDVLAVIASKPFANSRDAVIFSAWLRDTLSDSEALAELIDKVAGQTMRTVN